MLQGNEQFRIAIFNEEHGQKIAEFQIKMAKQTENLDLIPELVSQAIKYLSNHHDLGFYLVKLHSQVPIGSLLLTFENSQSWWIQSVYVQKDYRRQGHFKSLFNDACRVAKSKGSHSLKLYAESQNQKAKQTYRSLGMHPNGQKFYTYDFVYGKTKLQEFKKVETKGKYEVKPEKQIQINQLKFRDILSKQNLSKNRSISVYRNQELIAIAYYFTEFSQWRFGLAYYIDSLFIRNQLSLQDLNEIHVVLCKYFSAQTQINLGALRYIFRKNQEITKTLIGGEVEHYDVMEINF